MCCLIVFSEPDVVLSLTNCHLNDCSTLKFFTNWCCVIFGYLLASCCVVPQNLRNVMVFQHNKCSRANVVPSHFLFKHDDVWFDYFLCRLFTDSREIPIMDKASIIRRCFYHQNVMFLDGYACLPFFLRYVDKFHFSLVL